MAVLAPLVFAAVLLASAATGASGIRHGWLAIVAAFAIGAAAPLLYTLVLAREGRLFLRAERDVERSRRRTGRVMPLGWALASCLLVGMLVLTGLSRVTLTAALAGLVFGFWPGLLANFVRLRREGHWTAEPKK